VGKDSRLKIGEVVISIVGEGGDHARGGETIGNLKEKRVNQQNASQWDP